MINGCWMAGKFLLWASWPAAAELLAPSRAFCAPGKPQWSLAVNDHDVYVTTIIVTGNIE